MTLEVVWSWNRNAQSRAGACLFAVLIAVLFVPYALGQPGQGTKPVVQSFEKDAGSVKVRLVTGLLRIQPCAENVARITFSPTEKIHDRVNPFLSKEPCAATSFNLQDDPRFV